MINLFCGYDRREALGFHVFADSVIAHASKPVSIRALSDRGMPVGSNAFTFSRFLVPWLSGYLGHAIFCDASDMLCLDDIVDLDALFDDRFAVQVVKRPDYRTRHPIKYVGTSMQCPNRDYARKNWASVMLINCAHDYWRALTPDALEHCAGLSLLQFGGLRLVDDDKRGLLREVGELPGEWNRIVDEGDPVDGAKLMHWTAGIPAFPHYRESPGAAQWHAQRAGMSEVA